jgi:Histidine kinase
MICKRLALLISLLIIFNTGNAQQKKIDSLMNILNNHQKDDTVKANLLYDIGILSMSNSPKKTLQYAKELGILAKKINNSNSVSGSMLLEAGYYLTLFKLDSAILTYNKLKEYGLSINNKAVVTLVNGNLSNIYLLKGKTKEAIQLLKESIEEFKIQKDFVNVGKLLVNLTNAYNATGDRILALKMALEALTINSKYGDQNTISANNYVIGSIYGISGQFKEALKYHKNYATIQLELSNWSNTCSGLIAVANDFIQLKKTDSSITYWNAALKIAKENKLVALENKILLNLTNLNAEQNKEEEEITKLIQLKQYYESNGMQQELGQTLCKLAISYARVSNSYLKKTKLDDDAKKKLSISYIEEAINIANKTNNYALKEEAIRNLSTYYEIDQDYVKAYDWYKKYIVIRDSAINESQQVEISKLNLQYAFNKREDSLKLIQVSINANLQKEQFLNQQQEQNILLQSKELLLNKQTILNNNQQLSLLNKDKELQHLAYLKTQADLQTEQLLKGENEKQLTIAQKEKLLETAKVKSLSQENDFINFKRKQLLIYALGIIGLLSLSFLLFYNRNKNKQVQLKAQLAKEKAEQQTKEAEFQKSLTDVSLSALRSQMNPHFIFNCLNSIKLFTAQNDTKAATNYLTKFSKLIRMALENSRSETVNLQNEIESLELYIQMEAMRFKDKLKYTIDVQKDVDIDFIEIPPLLLQPYVENAIWHGLMHKEEGGNIDIAIRNAENKNVLIITVKDDGVGREKAAQLRSKTATTHKSFGTKVTSERLALINKLYKTEASVTTDDIIKNNEVAGTLVTIKIPFA